MGALLMGMRIWFLIVPLRIVRVLMVLVNEL
jgi:hypothetical protein